MHSVDTITQDVLFLLEDLCTLLGHINILYNRRRVASQFLLQQTQPLIVVYNTKEGDTLKPVLYIFTNDREPNIHNCTTVAQGDNLEI